jgi:hypothetical protein
MLNDGSCSMQLLVLVRPCACNSWLLQHIDHIQSSLCSPLQAVVAFSSVILCFTSSLWQTACPGYEQHVRETWVVLGSGG